MCVTHTCNWKLYISLYIINSDSRIMLTSMLLWYKWCFECFWYLFCTFLSFFIYSLLNHLDVKAAWLLFPVQIEIYFRYSIAKMMWKNRNKTIQSIHVKHLLTYDILAKLFKRRFWKCVAHHKVLSIIKVLLPTLSILRNVY